MLGHTALVKVTVTRGPQKILDKTRTSSNPFAKGTNTGFDKNIEVFSIRSLFA